MILIMAREGIKMTKFIVDRKTWYRGKGSENSRLLRVGDGMRCCIGHVGRQCGIGDDNLRGKAAIINVPMAVDHKWPKWMLTTAIKGAYFINDNMDMDDTNRELQLQALFVRYGDEIEFVG